MTQAVERAPLDSATRAGASAVLAKLRLHAATLEPRAWGFVHRDFYDKQVLVTPTRHVVIDFDTACTSYPELDLANYTAHLMLRGIQGYVTPAAAAAHAREFLLTYQREGRQVDGAVMTWSAACTWLRLVCVYAARPAWQVLPLGLLQLAARAAEERCRPSVRP